MTAAITTTLQSIPDLAAAMTVLDSTGAPTCRMSGVHHRFGVETDLPRPFFKMPAPSMLLA